MTYSVDYPYSSGDLLERPNTYYYSKFIGDKIFPAWRAAREAALNSTSTPDVNGRFVKHDREGKGCYATEIFLMKIIENLSLSELSDNDKKSFDLLLRNFEAKKRIYKDYYTNFTSKNRIDYDDIDLYLLFGEALVLIYRKYGSLPYLNALLKCLDITCAYAKKLHFSDQNRLTALIEWEKAFVNELSAKMRLANICL